jgi:hypothetical protein
MRRPGAQRRGQPIGGSHRLQKPEPSGASDPGPPSGLAQNQPLGVQMVHIETPLKHTHSDNNAVPLGQAQPPATHEALNTMSPHAIAVLPADPNIA